MTISPFVRLTATCAFCAAATDVTATDIDDAQPVLCGICSSPLGTVAELRDGAPAKSGYTPRRRTGGPGPQQRQD